ncbi:hypothetical protein ACOMHN_036696 [Nucella lapillus]
MTASDPPLDSQDLARPEAGFRLGYRGDQDNSRVKGLKVFFFLPPPVPQAVAVKDNVFLYISPRFGGIAG